MFQQSPAKSSLLAESGDDRTISEGGKSNSPHPVLNGVLLDDNRNSSVASNQNDKDVREEEPPLKRPYYASESEFIDWSRSKTAADANVNDLQSNIKIIEEPKTEESADDENENVNYSDDDDDDGQKQRASTEIPTLETYIPREPSYEKANAIPFAQVCKRLESLWNLRFTKRKVLSKQQKLECLLPNALKTYLDGGSPFPYLRLILPEHDSSRAHTGMKEARIAEVWAKALGCDKGTVVYKQLTGFRSAHVIKNPNSVGDLSCVIADVMKERGMPSNGSKLTVGEVNEWLDVLVAVVKGRFVGMTGTTAESDRTDKSSWRKSLEKAVAAKETAKKYDKYAILVEKLINKNLSPVEHKFIVRIILQHIHVGINLREILGYVHVNAMDLHYASNSLKELCALLSDPEYVRLLKATVEKNTRDIMESNRLKWMTPSTLPAVLGNTISPMLSRRTSFQTFLQEIAQRHEQLDKALPAESSAKSCLAIKHPAFTCEIKMDGERDLVHINRGIVTIQTRNGTWYSTLYSPAIGPALRAAISRYDVDVILDGEMISWDSSENKPIPFGTNRSVAEMNRNQRYRDGTLDPRDVELHKNDTDINVMALSKANDQRDGSSSDMNEDRCWLQYVVFDLLYVDGPDAHALIAKSRHLFAKDESIRTGSLINLSCMQRTSILYNLIETQDKVVEHIKRVVIRPDGSSMDGADYFLGRCGLEYGKMPCELDSIYLALCDESGTTKFDSQRCSKSYEDIEIQRSLELERLYNQIVSYGGQEGLIFKDLASPYYLGSKSRSMGYWWKLKPDYDKSSTASDIDLLVLGGYYATGFSKRGMMSSLIVGCLDTEHRYGGEGAKYMAVTKVSFNKDTERVLRECTGFRVADEYGQFNLGKWFEAEDLPSFISLESYQRNPIGDRDGWQPEKKDRPNLWINPSDSFVVTVNAAELTLSNSMQAGLTMRFPRITEYRGKGTKNPKNPDEVADLSELRTIFDEQEETRHNEVSFGSVQQETSRFLTAKQLQGGKLNAKKARKKRDEVKQFNIPEVATPLSQILDGFTFTVLPGNYCLEDDSYATAEAKEDGWESSAISVRSQKDVIRFIQSHGGTCLLTMHTGTDFILGGRATDASVSNLRTLMANTDRNSSTKKETDARRLLELGGILKWTFVFSIVSKFLTSLDDDVSGYNKSIKKDWPSLAHPHRPDFLVMSDDARTSLLQLSDDKYGLRIDEVARQFDFVRALEDMKRDKSKGTKLSWQVHAMRSFDESERWIFGGKMQKLWPYGKQADADSSVVIMYPDLFASLGLESFDDMSIESSSDSESPRWQHLMESKSLGRVAATLPLAKAMGAIITPHLHNGVTHILCDLKRHKKLSWSSMNPLSVFNDVESGSRLHERLVLFEESADCIYNVMLVSPDWLQEKWT